MVVQSGGVFSSYSSNSSETTEKKLRRVSKDINEFLFKAPMVAKKSDDFIYS